MSTAIDFCTLDKYGDGSIFKLSYKDIRWIQRAAFRSHDHIQRPSAHRGDRQGFMRDTKGTTERVDEAYKAYKASEWEQTQPARRRPLLQCDGRSPIAVET